MRLTKPQIIYNIDGGTDETVKRIYIDITIIFPGSRSQRRSRNDGVGRPTGTSGFAAYDSGNPHQRQDVQLGGFCPVLP